MGGGGCTDVWRFHNFETLRKTAEHTYALFVLVGINPDCELQSPCIGIETNLNLGSIMVENEGKREEFNLEKFCEYSCSGTELS